MGLTDRLNPSAAWGPTPTAIIAPDFEAVLDQHEVVVIHFWAAWNRVDRQMDVTVDQVMPLYRDRVRFYACDTDDPRNHRLWPHLRIATLPSLIMFSRVRPPRLLCADRRVAEVTTELDKFHSAEYVYRRWWDFWKSVDCLSTELNLSPTWLSSLSLDH